MHVTIIRQNAAIYTQRLQIVTPLIVYSIPMHILSLRTLLATHLTLGIVCAVLLFAICFLCVHVLRLARVGWSYQKKQKEQKSVSSKQQAQPPKPVEKQAETKPIYYIVERKRKARTSYSEPKQIQFK